MFLAAILDAFSHHVVRAGAVHYSDRDSWYASNDVTDPLRAHDIKISISPNKNPRDNEASKSFMKTVKYEEVDRN